MPRQDVSQLSVANLADNELDEAAAPQAADATAKYHVLMELGRGGMAIVEAAVSRGLGGFSKLVVLKKPRGEFAEQPEAVSTFLNEARISARMNHPNVVQVNEVYEEDGLPIIVMEYLEGQSFARLLQRYFEGAGGSMELGLSVLCRALEALDYAHTLTDFDGQPLNLIHRDVSPHNIMVTYDGRVKLLDFGIAKLDSMDGKTKTGLIKGKIDYMSPEQVDGRQLDGRADVFAIGVMIWEVAAKSRMWTEQSQAAVIKRLVLEDIPDLGKAGVEVDAELIRICRKATAADRDERYASARALLEDLLAFLEARNGAATDAAIARWISTACADLRSAARERMDKHLAAYSDTFTRLRDISGQAMLTELGERERSSGRRRTADTGAGKGYAMVTDETPRRLTARWPWALAAVVPAALGLWWSGVLAPQAAVQPKPPAPAVVAQPPVAPIVAQEPEVAPVRLTLQAKPEAAVMYLDGERLPSNPFSGARPRDTLEHELVIKADGFEPLTRRLRLDSDLELELSLSPSAPSAEEAAEHKAAAARAAVRRAPPPRRAAPAPRPAEPVRAEPIKAEPGNGCAVPFSIDAAGIKHYRRECIGK